MTVKIKKYSCILFLLILIPQSSNFLIANASSPIDINLLGKDQPEGSITTVLASVCGQDYHLASPRNAKYWVVNVSIISEIQTQNVGVDIYEVLGVYPYNYESQVNAPHASALGRVNLVVNLDPSKKYEIWVRDAYAKKFTGTLFEEWSINKLGADESSNTKGILSFYAESGQVLNSEWLTFHGDNQNTGYSSVQMNSPFSIKWQSDYSNVECHPIVANGTVFVGRGSRLIALNQDDGALKWSFDLTDSEEPGVWKKIVNAQAVEDNIVVVSCWDTIVFGLDAANGKLLWRYKSEYPLLYGATGGFFIQPSPKINDGVVYIPLGDGKVHAIDLHKGSKIWIFNSTSIRRSTPVIYNDLLIFAPGYSSSNYDPNFYAVKLSDGSLVWKKNVEGQVVSSPVVKDDVLYFGNSNRIYALNARNGNILWNCLIPQNNHIESSPTVSGDYLYVSGGDWGYDPPKGSLYCINKITGSLKWSIDGYFTRVTPSVFGNILFCGEHATPSGKGHIYAIDALTGDKIWTFTTNGPALSIPAYSDGVVYVAADKLYAIETNHVIVDKTKVNSVRYSVNKTHSIDYHLKWSYDSSNANGVKVELDGESYFTREDGWVTADVTSRVIGKTSYSAKPVGIFYENASPNVSIIWDKVLLSFEKFQRVGVGKDTLGWIGKYAYDNTPFTGSLIFNETRSKDTVGKYGYRVMSIIDPKYGVTTYAANDFSVIYDRVDLTLALSKARIDVGKEPDVAVSGKYSYDSKQFTGQVQLTKPTVQGVGTYKYSVQSISDPLYKLTSFTTNEVSCILDRIKILESGVSAKSVEIKQPVSVWFKAVYEYDNELFDGSNGSLFLNNEAMAWSQTSQRWETQYNQNDPQTLSLNITGVEDNKYGLTTFNDSTAPLSIQWVQPPQGIPGYPLLSVIFGFGIFFYYLKNNVGVSK